MYDTSTLSPFFFFFSFFSRRFYIRFCLWALVPFMFHVFDSNCFCFLVLYHRLVLVLLNLMHHFAYFLLGISQPTGYSQVWTSLCVYCTKTLSVAIHRYIFQIQNCCTDRDLFCKLWPANFANKWVLKIKSTFIIIILYCFDHNLSI